MMTGLTTRRVSPFGNLGINACVPLPRAFRSLPRPSSPPCAKASPTCPCSLDLVFRQAKHALTYSNEMQYVSKRYCNFDWIRVRVDSPWPLMRFGPSNVLPSIFQLPLSNSEMRTPAAEPPAESAEID